MKRVVFALALALGCASASVPEGANWEHRFFAARSDYINLGSAVNVYCGGAMATGWPGSTYEQCTQIDNLMDSADTQLAEFGDKRNAGEASASDYSAIIGTLERASEGLHQIAPEVGQQ